MYIRMWSLSSPLLYLKVWFWFVRIPEDEGFSECTKESLTGITVFKPVMLTLNPKL